MPLFDVMFGTYYVPGTCRAPMGALKINVPDTDIVTLYLFPLIEFFTRIKNSLPRFVKIVLPLRSFQFFSPQPGSAAEIDGITHLTE